MKKNERMSGRQIRNAVGVTPVDIALAASVASKIGIPIKGPIKEPGGVVHVVKRHNRWWCKWCDRPLNECFERMNSCGCREVDARLLHRFVLRNTRAGAKKK